MSSDDRHGQLLTSLSKCLRILPLRYLLLINLLKLTRLSNQHTMNKQEHTSQSERSTQMRDIEGRVFCRWNAVAALMEKVGLVPVSSNALSYSQIFSSGGGIFGGNTSHNGDDTLVNLPVSCTSNMRLLSVCPFSSRELTSQHAQYAECGHSQF